jgi:hypothetical protein
MSHDHVTPIISWRMTVRLEDDDDSTTGALKTPNTVSRSYRHKTLYKSGVTDTHKCKCNVALLSEHHAM